VNPAPPVVMAAVGPRMLELAGSTADRIALALPPLADGRELTAAVERVQAVATRPVGLSQQLSGMSGQLPEWLRHNGPTADEMIEHRAVGMLMGESRRFRLTTTPVVEALRFIVPFAWIPLTILWFGTSFTGKILLVAYAVFFVMVVSTARAVAHVEPTLSRVGTMLGMGPWRLAWKVHLRAAAPTIASAARAAAAIGWIAVVAAEYIGASAGLGLMITNAATSLATSVVIAGMIVIGIIGAGVSALIRGLLRSRLDYR
jgi:ABC-type proline/glycine betaine transport system permease subunit